MKIKISLLKYLSSAFFIILSGWSFLHTLIYTPEYWVRDFIILLILSLPIIVNRRLFYLSFGILASIISLLIIIIYAFKNTPNQIESSWSFYLLGLFLYLIIFSSSLVMIYIGMYSIEKGKFRLI